MKSDAAPAVGYWKVVAPPRTFQPNDLFRLFSREVRRWLRRLGDRRGNRSLVSTSVTFPDPIDPGSIFGMAHLFSEKLVRDLGDSIWMALGFGDQHYRPHWHGFAITDQPEDFIKSTWSDLTAGRAKITVITGSAEPWTLEVADPLRMNLNQVIRYALKPQVATIDIPAHSRVVAHGFLRSAWMKSTGLGIADPGTLLVPVSVDHNNGRSIFHQSDSDRPPNRATHDPSNLERVKSCDDHVGTTKPAVALFQSPPPQEDEHESTAIYVTGVQTVGMGSTRNMMMATADLSLRARVSMISILDRNLESVTRSNRGLTHPSLARWSGSDPYVRSLSRGSRVDQCLVPT